MKNVMKRETKKAKFPFMPTVVVVLAGLFFVIDEMDEDIIFLILGIVIMLVPLVLIFSVMKAIKKKSPTATHTHDRIDHNRDLTINPRTGKAENRPIQHAAQHSPEEHWKQQLDGLLANGTIDRSEYRALLRHKF